jgi:ABC-type hemin transport system ATPase subunit
LKRLWEFVSTFISSVDRFIRSLGYSYKKTLRASEQERADVAVARLLWRDWQKTCDPARLIFLDETGAGTDMTRRHGRSPWESDAMTTLPAVTGKP